jgi:phage tail-like protein
MTTLSLLPRIPRPPYDPSSMTLDATRGWRIAALDALDVDPTGGTLSLAIAAGGPSLTDPTGSFGGLVAPAWVAVGPGCDIWLLDVTTCTLKKLDECACVFIDVPGIGGPGSDARQFADPRGLVSSRGNLIVADTGNGRVSVFAQRGYVLRGTLEVPPSEIAQPWSPVAVAADCRGRVYVADPNNGCVHRFVFGKWERAIRALGDVRHVAVDCRGWLYVATSTASQVRVFDSQAIEHDWVTSVAAIRPLFAPLPFRVDSTGALDFSAGTGACRAAFDAQGAPLSNGAKPDIIKFATDGTFSSRALDSGIAQCQWHRVLLCGAIPAGTSITVLTYTSEVAEPESMVAALPDEAWETCQTARRAPKTDGSCVDWDCLVRSGPGRYLWLKLQFHGDARGGPILFRATLEMPRVSLAKSLPAVYGEDPTAGEFTDRFLSLFDTTLRSIEKHLDNQAAWLDPRSAPAVAAAKDAPDFLSWLASWVGISLSRQWPEARRRRFLREAPRLFARSGTPAGLRAMILLYLGLYDYAPDRMRRRLARLTPSPEPTPCGGANRCTPIPDPCAEPPEQPSPPLPALLLEHWRLRRWLFLGAGRLGDESVVWGKAIVNRSRLDDGAQADVTRLISEQDPYRDPFYVYASTFTVFVPARLACDATAQKGLQKLLRDESPAHTRWHLELVEPRFRIGVQSMIGYDSVVGRYPKEKVTLDESRLGRSTILGGPPDEGRGPSMRIGSTARIGSTTMLM